MGKGKGKEIELLLKKKKISLDKRATGPLSRYFNTNFVVQEHSKQVDVYEVAYNARFKDYYNCTSNQKAIHCQLKKICRKNTNFSSDFLDGNMQVNISKTELETVLTFVDAELKKKKKRCGCCSRFWCC